MAHSIITCMDYLVIHGKHKNVMKIFDVRNSVNLKTSYGGTATKNVKKMISKLKKEFK